MNLSPSEQMALKDLLNDSIIIRPADKGSSIVILDKEDYIKQVEKDLADNTTYKLSDEPLTAKINKKVTKQVKSMLKKWLYYKGIE